MNDKSDFFRNFQQELSQETIDRIWKKSIVLRAELTPSTPRLLTGRNLAWAAVSVIVLFVAVFSIPSLRSFAQGIIDLFPRAEDDTIYYILDAPDFSGRPVLDIEEIGAYYFQTIEGAEAKAGFDVYAPYEVPEGYHLVGAGYGVPPNKVELEFRFSESLSFRLVQQPVENFLSDPFRNMMVIGPTSLIKHVQIGQAEGQYVQGTWTINVEDLPEERQPPGTYEIPLHWDPYAPIRELRWEADGFVFTLRVFYDPQVTNGDGLTMEQMISIAEGVRP